MPDQLPTRLDQTISSRSAPEAIVERILDALTSGDLKAGDRLPDQTQLAKSFGVARMTLRNALVVLQELGLVSTARGRQGGTFIAPDVRERLHDMGRVTKISSAALRSFSDWRRAISGEACFLAALRASNAQLRQIEQAAQGFVDTLSDVEARRSADARFHVLIAEVTGSRHLIEQEQAIQEEFNVLYQALPPLVQPVGTQSMDHDPLLLALRTHDPDRARTEMIEHIESTHAWHCSLLRVKKLV
ncbi:FCD domain-containing protein [Paraburkholderia sp. D15]|uniref:FadR/GntR family transcriptional regulator n=1 Tax=Paraburkholderia sp. D15 TaxID=2880218 RepID=UPI0024793B6C|nr:FCD domain-containing protein [Paraburkholderia sp. D15]WGS48398.1 FCD domain-containing protein [Paraburkholderia sp. D15]WKF56280.1 Putative L-lactate dehydrogenase operon regulatory protein [Paraburkholderia busanensis]